MGSTVTEFESNRSVKDANPARVFHWIVSVLVVGGMCLAVPRSLESGVRPADIGTWVLASLLADLMFVRIWKSITLSMSLPVLLAAAYFHAPPVTALIAFLGCLDPLELRGVYPLERVLFNRAQIAVAAAAASLTMHAVGMQAIGWPAAVGVSMLGLAADCVVNVAFVTTSTVLSGRATWVATLKGMWGVEPFASLVLYASMSLIAPLFGLIYLAWGGLALLTCTAILMPFRLAYARIERLGVTLEVVRLREAALQKAYASAELERRDERLVVAGDLHDEVLPALFKVHLMGEVLKQDLASGRLLDLDEDLPELLEATRTAQRAVRHVVGNLRVKQSGPQGLVSAIRSCADQEEGDGRPRFELRLADLRVTKRAHRVLIQVAREAIVNASRYSGASHVRVELAERHAGYAYLRIEDNGNGFDPAAVDTSAHFGLQLMKDRVEAAGGKLSVSSEPGAGTSITVVVPIFDADDGQGRHSGGEHRK
jgi:signal transduction histidine kinase